MEAETSQETKQEEGFEKFVSDTVRGPKKGVYEHLLAQHLALAVASQPLKKIQYICEACLMIGEEERKSQQIDLEEVDVILKVCMSFFNAVNHKESYPAETIGFRVITYSYKEIFSIPWSFEETLENFRRYIEPWRNHNLEYYYTEIPQWQQKWLDAYNEEADEILERLKRRNLSSEKVKELRGQLKTVEAKIFFINSGTLTKRSFMTLQNDFIVWALPKVQQVYAKLARLVPPRLLRESILQFKGLHQVKSEENAGSLG